MRWDSLFDDLAGQLDHELGVDDAGLDLEEERLRRGRLTLRDRILACARAGGAPVLLDLADGTGLRLIPRTFGRDWFAAVVAGAEHRELVIPVWAVSSIRFGPAEVEMSLAPADRPESRLVDRLTLSFVLRDLSRRRTAVRIACATGTVHGTIDRVGRDHLDVAVHEPGSPRRSSNVVEIRVIAFTTVVSVERSGLG